MLRRYNLARSDNFPATGASVILSDTVVLEDEDLSLRFAPEVPALVTRINLNFSRSSFLRDINADAYLVNSPISPVNVYSVVNSTKPVEWVLPPFSPLHMLPGDYIDIVAKIAESTKSSSSSSSSPLKSSSSSSSISLSSQSSGGSSESSVSSESSASSASSLNSISSQSSASNSSVSSISSTSSVNERRDYVPNFIDLGGGTLLPSTPIPSASSVAYDMAAYNAWIDGGWPWIGTYSSGVNIGLDFTSYPVALNAYRLYAPEIGGLQAASPTEWTFQGSNNGSSWTVLDSRTGQNITGAGGRYYVFSNTTEYRYYRFFITARSNIAYPRITISDIQMYENESVHSHSRSSGSSWSSSSDSSSSNPTSSTISTSSKSSSTINNSTSSLSSTGKFRVTYEIHYIPMYILNSQETDSLQPIVP